MRAIRQRRLSRNVFSVSLSLSLVLVVSAGSSQPVFAWTQAFNGGSTSAACNPCVAYPDLSSETYYFTSIFNVNFKAAFRTAADNWSVLPYRNPVWYEGTAGLKVTAGNLAADLCGTSSIYADTAHYIQASASNIQYNQNKQFDTGTGGGTSTVCNLNWTLNHEVGHSGNGLSHSAVVGSLMVTKDNRVQRPQQDEFNALAAIYGAI